MSRVLSPYDLNPFGLNPLRTRGRPWHALHRRSGCTFGGVLTDEPYLATFLPRSLDLARRRDWARRHLPIDVSCLRLRSAARQGIRFSTAAPFAVTAHCRM
jgi:hypothetical protein